MMVIKSSVLVLCLCASIVAGNLKADQPEYFFKGPNTTETGGVIGENVGGNPAEWSALYAQLSGQIVREYVRIHRRENGNCVFLWTRSEGDARAYRLIPTFEVRSEGLCRIVLEVGFDDVCRHIQVPWPKGYWRSNESLWVAPFSTGSEPNGVLANGTVTLNKQRQYLDIPATVKQVYIRIRITGVENDASEGRDSFIWIEKGAVDFEVQ